MRSGGFFIYKMLILKMGQKLLFKTILIFLLLHLSQTYPTPRTPYKRSEDGLISGSDFLSVFIGSTLHPNRHTYDTRDKYDSDYEADDLEQQTDRITNTHNDVLRETQLSSKPTHTPVASNSTQTEILIDQYRSTEEEDMISTTNSEHNTVKLHKEQETKSSHRTEEYSEEPTTPMQIDVNTEYVTSEYVTDHNGPSHLDRLRNIILSKDSVEPSLQLLSNRSFKPIGERSKYRGKDSIDKTDINVYDNFISKTDSNAFSDDSRSDEPIFVDENKNETHKIVSVKVSSSAVQSPIVDSNIKSEKELSTNIKQDIFATFLKSFSETTDDFPAAESSAESASLVTEIQPSATAIQRSELFVEESQPASSVVTSNGEISFPPNAQAIITSSSLNRNTNPQISPILYQTSISSETSKVRTQFYSKSPSFTNPTLDQTAPGAIHSSVVTSHSRESSLIPNRHLMANSHFSQSVQIQVPDGKSENNSPVRLYLDFPTENSNINTNKNHRQSLMDGVKEVENLREQKSYSILKPVYQETSEKNYEEPEKVHTSMVSSYGQQEMLYNMPERMYGTPEKMYGMAEKSYGTPEKSYGMSEQNYEIDESVSVMSNGRVHGARPTASVTTPSRETATADDSSLRILGTQEDPNTNQKFGYVVEGRNFRKYRVEERTPDGFIVGEYGVVSHDDGSLRGVRYTADGTINPRVIYDALVKFLSL